MRKIKRILIVAGSLAAIVAILFGVIKWTSNEKTTVSSFKFKIGDLSAATGEYSESSTAIYTEELIECEGLSIVPDFESKCTYRIFWYNLDGEFISATEETTKYTEEFSGEAPLATEYCRIVIYPYPTDENGKTLRNFDIKFYEVVKYANQLTIKVNKKQTEPIDYFASAEIFKGNIYSSELVNVINQSDSLFLENVSLNTLHIDLTLDSVFKKGNSSVLSIRVNKLKTLLVRSDVEINLTYSIFNEAGKIIDMGAYVYQDGIYGSVESTISLDSSAYIILLSFDSEQSFEVYGYQPR